MAIIDMLLAHPEIDPNVLFRNFFKLHWILIPSKPVAPIGNYPICVFLFYINFAFRKPLKHALEIENKEMIAKLLIGGADPEVNLLNNLK